MISIAILSATIWEVKLFIRKLDMARVKRDLFRYRNSNMEILVSLSGIGKSRARSAAEAVLAGSPDAIFSVGFAGALKDGMGTGELALDSHRSDFYWRSVIGKIAAKNNLVLHEGKFYCSPQVVLHADQKRKIGEEKGTIAIEMESEAIYDVCRSRNVPFCSFRTISDEVDETLPAFLAQLGPDGKVSTGLMKSLGCNPSEWGSFVRLLFSTAKAQKNLCTVLLDFARGEGGNAKAG